MKGGLSLRLRFRVRILNEEIIYANTRTISLNMLLHGEKFYARERLTRFFHASQEWLSIALTSASTCVVIGVEEGLGGQEQ